MFSGHLLCCLCRDAFFIRPGQSEQEHILSQRPEKVPRVSRQRTPSSSIVLVLVWSITSRGRAETPEVQKSSRPSIVSPRTQRSVKKRNLSFYWRNQSEQETWGQLSCLLELFLFSSFNSVKMLNYFILLCSYAQETRLFKISHPPPKTFEDHPRPLGPPAFLSVGVFPFELHSELSYSFLPA